MTFVDICWHFPLYLVFTLWLRFVNHLLNYLLTYLLKIGNLRMDLNRISRSPDENKSIIFSTPTPMRTDERGSGPCILYLTIRWHNRNVQGVDCTSPPRRRGPTAKCFSSYTLSHTSWYIAIVSYQIWHQKPSPRCAIDHGGTNGRGG